MNHPLPSEFRRRAVAIDLVGCGGTGSRLLPILADLHNALLMLGHPEGLYVTVSDPDIVTEPSVGRTIFSASDVGQFKAALGVSRVNLFHGTLWRAFPVEYTYPVWNMERAGATPDIVITTTHSLRSRVAIYHEMLYSGRMPPKYWLDCGNAADTGQVIMGELDGQLRHRAPLRTVVDVFPGMIEEAESEEEEPESCSLADALSRQGLFINRHMALWAGELLWRFFRDGYLNYHGVFVNTLTGRTNALMVDPNAPLQVIQAGAFTLPPLPKRGARKRPGSEAPIRHAGRALRPDPRATAYRGHYSCALTGRKGR